MAPNGLIAHFGPIEGRRLTKPNGKPYVIYGDPAYGVTQNILAPFRGANLSQEEQEFNREMSKVRVCVEWGFWKNCTIFCILRFQEESQSSSSTSCKILHGWCPLNQLSYMFI